MSSLGGDSQTTASKRRTDPPALVKLLRGDLDWIVMRALEKERSRRYGSASELAADIRRHLDNQPVLARPPGTLYRARKFVLRHRLAVTAAAMVLLALVGGLGLASYGLLRATRAESAARQEADNAGRIAGFMVELFEGPDPGEARGNTVTAREILDRGVQRIENGLADQPETQAVLMETMGRVYRVMGLYKDALPLLLKAVEIRERSSSREPLALAAALNELGTIRGWLGDHDQAAELSRRALSIRERELGPDHVDVAESLNTLAVALQNVGELDEAEALHRRAVALREEALGPDHGLLGVSVHNLAIVRYFQGAYDEAESLYRRAAVIEERSGGEDNHNLATSLHTLAILLGEQDRYDEAIPLEQRSLAIREKVLGPDHPHVSFSLTYLGEFHIAVGAPEAAEPLLRRAIEIATSAWDSVYPETRWMRRNLALSLAEQGRTETAEAELRRLLADTESGAAETALPSTLNALGELLVDLRRFAEAEAQYRRAIEIDERLSGKDSPYLAPAIAGLASLERKRGRHEQAAELYRRGIGILEAGGDSHRADLARLLNEYAACLTEGSHADEAERVAQRARELSSGTS